MTKKGRSRKTFASRVTRGVFLKFYNDHIHITRSIDEAKAKIDPTWMDIPQRARYQIIHQDLGVQWAFDLYARYT